MIWIQTHQICVSCKVKPDPKTALKYNTFGTKRFFNCKSIDGG